MLNFCLFQIQLNFILHLRVIYYVQPPWNDLVIYRYYITKDFLHSFHQLNHPALIFESRIPYSRSSAARLIFFIILYIVFRLVILYTFNNSVRVSGILNGIDLKREYTNFARYFSPSLICNLRPRHYSDFHLVFRLLLWDIRYKLLWESTRAGFISTRCNSKCQRGISDFSSFGLQMTDYLNICLPNFNLVFRLFFWDISYNLSREITRAELISTSYNSEI